MSFVIILGSDASAVFSSPHDEQARAFYMRATPKVLP